jgi:hypothetical protein
MTFEQHSKIYIVHSVDALSIHSHLIAICHMYAYFITAYCLLPTAPQCVSPFLPAYSPGWIANTTTHGASVNILR